MTRRQRHNPVRRSSGTGCGSTTAPVTCDTQHLLGWTLRAEGRAVTDGYLIVRWSRGRRGRQCRRRSVHGPGSIQRGRAGGGEVDGYRTDAAGRYPGPFEQESRAAVTSLLR
jgi:hypothetical protein